MLDPCSPPGILDKDSPHRLGRGAKEVSTAVPMLSLLDIHEPDIGLMHQRRGLQRLTRFLLSQLGGGQLPQLLIHQRQELFGGTRVARFDLR